MQTRSTHRIGICLSEILGIRKHFNDKQQLFLDFVLHQYVQVGVQELDQEKLSPLLKLRYDNAIADAIADLGRPEEIGFIFSGFQKYLYQHTPPSTPIR